MKEVIREVLGVGETSFKVPMQFYESVDEGDKAAGRAGAVLDECNLNLAYRGSYADARELIVDIVQELTKVPMKQKDTGEKDDKGVPIMEDDEKESKYVERAMAATPSVTVAQVQALIDKRARGYSYIEDGKTVTVGPIAVDIKQKERKPRGPKKLAAKYLDKASAILKGPNLKKFIADVKKNLNKDWVATNDATKDAESLGWVVKEFAAWKEQQALDLMG